MTILRAVDLFAGAGGATQGLRDAGFEVVGAVENDLDSAASYRLNHPQVVLAEKDIRDIAATKFRDELGLKSGDLALLKACPPCQGFSTLAGGRDEDVDRNDLVNTITRFVRAFRPASVLIENVPGLRRNYRFVNLVEQIARMGYATKSYVVDATQFGVPQRRRRLIVIAIRGAKSELPDELVTHADRSPATVREAFARLAIVQDGNDSLNIARRSAGKVQQRIAAVPVGGTRFDLPDEYQLKCHKRVDAKGRSATASYGRLKLDAPAPTMTTRCTTPACGSFIHPTEHRGITLREAATIQTFPFDYQFVGKYGSVERQIGNAVPVRMAEALGLAVRAAINPRKSGGSRKSTADTRR